MTRNLAAEDIDKMRQVLGDNVRLYGGYVFLGSQSALATVAPEFGRMVYLVRGNHRDRREASFYMRKHKVMMMTEEEFADRNRKKR